jgi:hypothetical protein
MIIQWINFIFHPFFKYKKWNMSINTFIKDLWESTLDHPLLSCYEYHYVCALVFAYFVLSSPCHCFNVWKGLGLLVIWLCPQGILLLVISWRLGKFLIWPTKYDIENVQSDHIDLFNVNTICWITTSYSMLLMA